MPDNRPRNKSHFFLSNHGSRSRYTSPVSGGSRAKFPVRNAAVHAVALEVALKQAVQNGSALIENRNPALDGGEKGFYLEFELPADYAAASDKLENKQGHKHIELLTVRPADENKVIATVFVPESRKDYYLKKIQAYGESEKGAALYASVENIRIANLRSIFTDDQRHFPNVGEQIWWEVWVVSERVEIFLHATRALNIDVKEHPIKFAERIVLLVSTTPENLASVINNTNAIAELRLARDNPAFYTELTCREQGEWVDDLASRTHMPPADAPAICILDSGCTRGHQLIQPLLAESDWQAYKAEWSPGDTGAQWGGHGTEMAGLAIYGDLSEVMESTGTIEIRHKLETIKILPDVGQNEPHLYGAVTGASVALAELRAPERQRTICMAVTAPGENWFGRPSSWSAAVDDLAYGDEIDSRLFVISAGNIRGSLVKTDYITRNDLSLVENPAQAWNVLSVGAYTEKTNITSEGFTDWEVVAPLGDMSPCSRTSIGVKKWPIKPDIMLEGGNLATPPNSNLSSHIDDLSLMTTFSRPQERLLTTTGDTSAATALAARIAAQIFSERPALWPETVRALIIHSAEWTDAMKARLPANPSKSDYANLVSRYGYGVPSLDRALRSIHNDVTMVTQGIIQPFLVENNSIKTSDLILHEFMWPRHALIGLANTPVEMKVTLSYFIEPNPGERGWTKHHTYASHGLRFIVKSSTESVAAFHSRINTIAREEEQNFQGVSMPDEGWLIGPVKRNRGSVHSDIWQGSAIELANKHAIAVYPVGGWWREKPALRRAERKVRYALVVSLRAPTSENVDLYTPIETQILPEVLIET
jgi:hypothetical protein